MILLLFSIYFIILPIQSCNINENFEISSNSSGFPISKTIMAENTLVCSDRTDNFFINVPTELLGGIYFALPFEA